ncbi:MAG: ABC transporter permease, partial [Natronospirillum sp.]
GRPTEVNGIEVHPTYTDHWPVLEQMADAWASVASGQGALISEQLARLETLTLGDPIHLPATDVNKEWNPKVVGIYADYGNPRGQMLVDLNRLQAYGPLTRQGFSVRLEPNQASQLVAAVRDAFDLSSNEAIDQAAVKAYSSAVFDRTFVATGALTTLTLAVAGIALLTSLLTLSHSRLSQLAPLWSLGVPHQTLARLEGQRTLLLALLTVILAIPLGLALAWCLVAVINVEAFGWRLPLYFFPRQWGMLAILSAVTALLAIAWPIWQLRHRPVSEWIKVFAHE